MNPSFYTTVEDLMNEINQINREIYPTNLHITEFYKIKNGFNYKCGTIYFEVVYSYKTNQFRLNKRNPFKEKEYYITLNEAKDLKDSLMAVVLNLVEQSTTKEAKKNLLYSKANEYEEVLTILDKLTVSPYSYNKKNVYSSVVLQLFKKGKEVWSHRTQLYANEYYLNFISELNRVQIEKLIKALTPIIAKIDEEVAKIKKEENQAEMSERNEITRRLKRNITTKVDFEKLNLRELKQLDNLIKKMKK